jgi:glycosyltransferase involved in cell wall biosynthesis
MTRNERYGYLRARVEDEMPYLRNANVFVLPSLQEGSGSVALLEALKAGAGCIRTDSHPTHLPPR